MPPKLDICWLHLLVQYCWPPPRPAPSRTWLNAPEAPMLYAVEPMSPARSSQDRGCSSIIHRDKSGSPGSNMHIAQAKIW